MKNLRIAFCFSGQLRTWEYCSENWNKFINKFNVQPDIFTHFWDFNTNSQRFIPIDDLPTQISDEEIQKYLNFYKPKKSKIDKYDVLNKININYHNIRDRKKIEGENIINNINWMMPQFYSLNMSTLLKREYEIENNFQYDVCFKLRNDVILDEQSMNHIMNLDLSDPTGKQKIYVIHSQVKGGEPSRIGDMMFFGNSMVFDMVSEFYNRLPSINIIDNGYPPEVYLGYYVRSLLIPHVETYLNLKVIRDNKHKEIMGEQKLEPYDIDGFIKNDE